MFLQTCEYLSPPPASYQNVVLFEKTIQFTTDQTHTAFDALPGLESDPTAELNKYRDLSYKKILGIGLDFDHPVINLFMKIVVKDGIHKPTIFSSTKISNIYEGLENYIEQHWMQSSERSYKLSFVDIFNFSAVYRAEKSWEFMSSMFNFIHICFNDWLQNLLKLLA